MHPSAFSRRMSKAERNYISNQELLAVKVALAEWRHWLEGAKHPFIVWTKHKNLEYVRKAKTEFSPGQVGTVFCFVLFFKTASPFLLHAKAPECQA